MTLAEFVLDRLGDDEQRARILAETRRNVWGAEVWDGPESPYPDTPSRVLADCEAKRRIVASVEEWPHAVIDDCWYTCPAATDEREGEECCNDATRGGACDCGRDHRVQMILSLLALPYSSHPDYDEAWKP